MQELTQQELKSVLHYDSDTGLFTAVQTKYGRVAGQVVGYSDKYGYLHAYVKGTVYKLHRLAFLYMLGEMPKLMVDHINGNPSDNRWCNLREVSCHENLLNAKLSKRNKTGHKGVEYKPKLKKKKWRAQVMTNGVVWKRFFHTMQEAVDAIRAHRAEMHGEYCNHG
jgi:hypothetical protein